ncbi:MAG: hypothetical protein PHS54_05825 [Clostridia bacterium]|nr:hypothetical protein [Clostridia bacterium]
MSKRREIRVAFDTNMIFDLHKIKSGTVEHNKKNNEDYLALKKILEILETGYENEKNKELFVFYPQKVGEEFIRGSDSLDRSFLTLVRKYEFEEICIHKKDEIFVSFLVKLLFGTNKDYGNKFNRAVFNREDSNDAVIMAQCGVANMPLVTLNKNHFIGTIGDIRNEIVNRFQEPHNYLIKHGIMCQNSFPITPEEFLEDYFPEKYLEMKKELNYEKVGQAIKNACIQRNKNELEILKAK